MASASSAASASVTPPPGSLGEERAGFPREVLGTELESKYLCSQCRNILRRPFQAQCGHRFCAGCLRSLISSGPQKCGACIQEGIYEDGVSILETGSAFPDNAARREVESLPAVCAHQGCAWKGNIKEYEAHDEVCPKFPLSCEGCGKKKIPREKFPEHVKSCSKCKAPCRFQPVGCSVVAENESLPEHEGRSLAEHLYLLLGFVLSLRPAPPLPRTPYPGPGPGPPSLSEEEEGHPRTPLLLSEGPAAPAAPVPPPAPGFSELLTRCQALEQKAATFENIVCVLNREVERGALAAQAHQHQHRLDQEKIEALSTKVRQLERSLASKDLALAEVEHSLQELEAASFDGVFVWKISDFAKKRQEAVAGRAPAIFSPAFYTGKYGYKMCLRIYLNGDGTGRGSHLSLFFVVMRGPCDALLPWPFNQKVTLMLLDQSHREHVIDAFRPDVSSSSFQRPVSDMNIASGCPLFCPLAAMDGHGSYLRDDAIFVKAIVDLTGL